MSPLYPLLDPLLFLLHAALVLFNLTGWAWRRTRRLHLITISLTLLSWFGLGLFYGWGYCPCTDWHWEIKHQLGESDLPPSYIKYYLDRWSGLEWDPWWVDLAVLGAGIGAFFLSIEGNLRDRRATGDAKTTSAQSPSRKSRGG